MMLQRTYLYSNVVSAGLKIKIYSQYCQILKKFSLPLTLPRDFYKNWIDTVKLGNKERFDNEKICVKDCDQFPVYFIKIRNIWR